VAVPQRVGTAALGIDRERGLLSRRWGGQPRRGLEEGGGWRRHAGREKGVVAQKEKGGEGRVSMCDAQEEGARERRV